MWVLAIARSAMNNKQPPHVPPPPPAIDENVRLFMDGRLEQYFNDFNVGFATQLNGALRPMHEHTTDMAEFILPFYLD